ncbi:sigma-70 family RNA polymerase sigma factor [Haloechinothrix salitolerans]|uniref:RNA polymerase sigma factor n=1 Tax=Haloechinothrix salitolerans TaxID=926830 RepID=A0ABW2BXQ4_9PSEU
MRSDDGSSTPPLPDAGTSVDDFVSTLTPRLRTVLRRCKLGDADVDDVVQEVWLRFLEHRDAIRHPERAAGWLRTIAVREAMRVLRHYRAESPTEDVTTGVTPDADNPCEDVARRDRDRTLWRVVATLPARDRLLAHLIARAPAMSYADIAARLGVTPASVGQLRTRCLRRLRRALARAGITAP